MEYTNTKALSGMLLIVIVDERQKKNDYLSQTIILFLKKSYKH
jgi:hypothetical protein